MAVEGRVEGLFLIRFGDTTLFYSMLLLRTNKGSRYIHRGSGDGLTEKLFT